MLELDQKGSMSKIRAAHNSHQNFGPFFAENLTKMNKNILKNIFGFLKNMNFFSRLVLSNNIAKFEMSHFKKKKKLPTQHNYKENTLIIIK